MATKNKIIIGGEITTTHKPNYEKVVNQTIKEIGYNTDNLQVEVLVNEQSSDIAQSINKSIETREQNSKEQNDTQGAGDQGIMYGYACTETPELMPLSFMLARNLTNRLTEVRQKQIIKDLMPDGKSQVTVKFDECNKPEILSILISTQHKENLTLQNLREQVNKLVIEPVFKDYELTNTQILINPSGRFVIGGCEGDTGVTGRKLQVDSYGTIAKQGGGAYSGKDPSKVDRSGAYICRYIAKNIVVKGIAQKCEVTLVYAIGKANPLAFNLNFFGTQTKPHYDEQNIEETIKSILDLRVGAIIKTLNLQNPIYAQTTKQGHFGNSTSSWEQLNLNEKIGWAIYNHLKFIWNK
jgi:S-adenosylmethionine synthetase